MGSPSGRDIEESSEQLDLDEKTVSEKQETKERWERGQRDLVTQVIDYTLGNLVELVNDDFIDLDPAYQRRDRWDVIRKSRLIESLLLNIPVPPIFLNEDEFGKYSIIDGKQRIGAVVDFLEDRYELKGLDIFYEANGSKFSQLDVTLQRVLRTRASLRGTILLHVSDPSLKYDVFDRLNTGGVSLNAQEVRNNAFGGPFNNLIVEIGESATFHKALHIEDKTKSATWREMRDAELVLRYFAFREDWKSYSGSISEALNRFMRDNIRAPREVLDEMREEFYQTLEKARAAFGQSLFRRWQPERQSFRQQVLVSIYDAQMIAVRGYQLEQIKSKSPEIEQGMKDLFSDADFRQSVDAATNTTMSLKKRISIVIDLFERVLA